MFLMGMILFTSTMTRTKTDNELFVGEDDAVNSVEGNVWFWVV